MASTFLGLTIASSGLTAANAGINVTTNNISNVNTKGYSRQVVTQQATKSIRVYAGYGTQGAGVTVTGIDQMRDSYYDQKYWKNQGSLGEYTQKNYYTNQIEELFFSEIKSTGFTTYYSNFTNALDTLYSSPSDSSKRNAAIQAAQTLSSYFNDTATSLNAYQDDANMQISVLVDHINMAAQNIASLNKQISILEANGGTANELRDQRANLVDELSQYVGVTVSEKTSDTGSSSYSIKICGQTLVEGYSYKTLKVEARDSSQKRHTEDNEDLYNIKWSDGTSFSTYNSSLTGSLKGYIDIRDGNNQEIVKFPTGGQVGVDYKGIPYYKAQTNIFAQEYARQFNMIQMRGQNLNNESTKDTPFFTVSTMTTDEVREESKKLFDLYKNTDANATATVKNSDGTTTTWTKADVEDWVNEKALVYAKENHPTVSASNMVDQNGKVLDTYIKEYIGTDTSMSTMVMIDYIADQTTAGNLCVNEELILDNSLMATTNQLPDGIDSQDLIYEMAKLSEKRFLANGTAEEFMEGLTSVSAIDSSTAKSMQTNYENISATISNQRLAISGVDEDEEGVNLVKYQHAYNLAAKCITIMSELYDKLINQTAV